MVRPIGINDSKYVSWGNAASKRNPTKERRIAFDVEIKRISELKRKATIIRNKRLKDITTAYDSILRTLNRDSPEHAQHTEWKEEEINAVHALHEKRQKELAQQLTKLTRTKKS